MLWIYGHYNVFNSFSAGAVFRRQILTSKGDPRAESVNDANILDIAPAFSLHCLL